MFTVFYNAAYYIITKRIQERNMLDTLKTVTKVEVLPYHTLGAYKWKELGIPYKLEGVEPPTEDRIQNAKKILEFKK